MDIEFVWNPPPTGRLDRDKLESKLRSDLEDHPTFVPCHRGKTQIYLSPADPLEVTIKGQVVCQCGKDLGGFSCNSDASTAIFKPA